MKIKQWITHEVVTIEPETSVREAFGKMKSLGIRHLPVVREGKLLGMVTDRDLRRPKISDVFKTWEELYQISDDIQVEDVMTTPVVTVHEEDTVQKAAQLMVDKRIGGLPVLNADGKLAGIIVESDILRAFVAGKR